MGEGDSPICRGLRKTYEVSVYQIVGVGYKPSDFVKMGVDLGCVEPRGWGFALMVCRVQGAGVMVYGCRLGGGFSHKTHLSLERERERVICYIYTSILYHIIS